MRENKVQFIIKKYVMAESAIKAIKLDKDTPVHDVWVDEDWRKETKRQLNPAIGIGFCGEEDYEKTK